MADNRSERKGESRRSRSYSSDKKHTRSKESSSLSSSRCKKPRYLSKKSRNRSSSSSSSSEPIQYQKRRRRKSSRSSSSSSSSSEPSRHRRRTKSSSSSSSEERKPQSKERKSSRKRKIRTCSTSPSSSSSDSSDSDAERTRTKKSKHKKPAKAKKKRKKTKKKEKKNKHAVNQSKYGKYGILTEADQFSKQPEFYCWLQEVRKCDPETIPRLEIKKIFEDFMEDYNTATFPHKKYYDLAKWEMKQDAKKKLRALKNAQKNPISFADDESNHTRKFKGEEKRYGLSKEKILEMKRSMKERSEQEYKKNVGF